MVIWVPKFSILVVNESHNTTLLLKLESWTRIPCVVSSRSHFESGQHMVITLLPASGWRSSLLHLRWHLCWLIRSLKTVQYLTPAEILAVAVQQKYEAELLHVLGKVDLLQLNSSSGFLNNTVLALQHTTYLYTNQLRDSSPWSLKIPVIQQHSIYPSEIHFAEFKGRSNITAFPTSSVDCAVCTLSSWHWRQ